MTLCMCVPTCDGYTNTYNEREVLFDSYVAALSPKLFVPLTVLRSFTDIICNNNHYYSFSPSQNCSKGHSAGKTKRRSLLNAPLMTQSVRDWTELN